MSSRFFLKSMVGFYLLTFFGYLFGPLIIFGEGGGRKVAESLSRSVGADVPLLGQVPLDPALVAAGDCGVPLVLSAPDSAAGKELLKIADALSSRKRGLAGMSLGLDPAGR